MTIPERKHEYAPVAIPVGTGEDPVEDGVGLDEGLIAAPADAPSTEAQPYLEVVAPATLPEGYAFDAESNGCTFSVKVPVGGVEQGQRFSVPFPPGSNVYSGSAIPRPSVPVGHWKDGLCDCFAHGPVHPALWNACCCPLLLVGQVMRRLKLTWLANEGGTIAQTTGTFRILLWITIIYQISFRGVKYLSVFYVDEHGRPEAGAYVAIYMQYLFIALFGLFTIVLVCRTRRRIRERYGIPERQCRGCEDCCCAYWCACCTVAQMARHTADYGTYAGLCCSETGVPAHAPEIV